MSGAQHFDHELGELDRQIVRLGSLCGFDLSQDATINALLNGEISAESVPEESRRCFVLLKGLLSLRYMVEKQCVDEIGAGQCQQIVDATLLK